MKRREISKKHLVNKLNSIHFNNGTIIVHFSHEKYQHTIACRARPKPCDGDLLECTWDEPEAVRRQLLTYRFENILIPCGTALFQIKADESRIDMDGIRLPLPPSGLEIGPRQYVRYPCEGIGLQMIQNSVSFQGTLSDFSPVAFRAEVSAAPRQTFRFVNPELPVEVILSRGKEMLFSGSCRVIRHTGGRRTRGYVLQPTCQHIRRFKPKEFRSIRQRLVPLPNMLFPHPLTGRLENLKVVDLSGCGFSVEEEQCKSTLMPGMVIPDLQLSFFGGFNIRCKAQVVYRHPIENGARVASVKIGMAILDMGMEDHGRLLAILQQAHDDHAYISTRVDMEELWSFFFQSGFIYPQKYIHIQENKERIKAIYERLYGGNQKIARHFTYQDRGRILGHLAMVRFYENSWLIHHHAADSSMSLRAGLSVLDQIGRFINDSHNFTSIRMDYVFCYFRPENRFPRRIFGGAYDSIQDPEACSIDSFAYFHCRKTPEAGHDLHAPWKLSPAGPDDLAELDHYYAFASGGLMLKAMGLESESEGIGELSREYRKFGCRRERYLYALRSQGKLKAVVVANVSDVGLNLSDLTSSFTVLVIDSDGLTKEVFLSMLSALTKHFDQTEIPVLLFPHGFADARRLFYEKLYHLWIMDMQYTDRYFQFVHSVTKRGARTRPDGRPPLRVVGS